ANHLNAIYAIECALQGARGRDPPGDSEAAALRTEDIRRAGRPVPFKLAHDFAPPRGAARRRPRHHRAKGPGDLLRAEHVRVPGSRPSPDGMGPAVRPRATDANPSLTGELTWSFRC